MISIRLFDLIIFNFTELILYLILKFHRNSILNRFFKLNFAILILVSFKFQFCFTQDTLLFSIVDKENNFQIKNANCEINGKLIKPNNEGDFIFIPTTDSIFIFITAPNYEAYLNNLSCKNFPAIFRLDPISKELQTVKITATQNQQKALLENLQLSKREIKLLPTFLGENDPVKVLQLLPGVQSGIDGNGIFVRGGNNDQNLILYDDVPLYNISHLFGFFSVFNSNAIQSLSIHKNAIPSQYGGRVSSVIDIKSQKGNLRKWNAESNLGVLATSIHFDGPLKKDTSAISFSARRTYVDLFQKLLSESSQMNATNYFFYDINLNYYRILNKKNTFYISAFNGKDKFSYKDQWNLKNIFENSIAWNSKLISGRIETNFSNKLNQKWLVAVNSYDLNFGATIYNFGLDLGTKNNDLITKLEYNYNYNNRLKFNYGLESLYHQNSPNNYQINGLANADSYNKNDRLYSLESSVFIGVNYDLNTKWNTKAGFRFSNFNQLGPFTRTALDSIGQTYVLKATKKGEIVHSYFRPEPRLSLYFHPSDNSTYSISYNQSYQYLHLAPISSLSLPTDVWVASSSVIKPQEGRQISIGYEYKFNKHPLILSVESYYKRMNNLIEYKQGVLSLTVLNTNYDDNFYFGKGDSYGIEFYFKKSIGKLNGWLSYTLSKSTRTFNDIENGRTYFSKNDRRHNASLVLNYQLNSKWTASMVFVFQTGNAITIPLSNYFLEGNVINTYSPKNSFRLPSYNRMDISITYAYKQTERKESSLNFSIYNCYARQNPFYYYYETVGNLDKLQFATQLKQISLINILPSISWKVIFK